MIVQEIYLAGQEAWTCSLSPTASVDEADEVLCEMVGDIDETSGEIEAIKRKIAKYQAKIDRLQYSLDERNQSRLAALDMWHANRKPSKVTKTQAIVKLPSGKVYRKQLPPKPIHDKDVLLAYLQRNGMQDYIKSEPRWGEYKKRLETRGNVVIDKETGEVVEGVVLEQQDSVFDYAVDVK